VTTEATVGGETSTDSSNEEAWQFTAPGICHCVWRKWWGNELRVVYPSTRNNYPWKWDCCAVLTGSLCRL